jgi:RimJ/RimL family protein N-acetyltransferase
MQVFLEMPRLVLRRFTMADADNLVSLDADPDVMHFITGGIPTARDEIEDDILPYPIEGNELGDVEYALDRAGRERQQAGRAGPGTAGEARA